MDPVLDTAPCGFLSFADNGVIRSVNATLRQWLGHAPGGLHGQHLETLLPLPSRIFYQTHFFPLLKIAGSVEEVYMALRTATGSELPVLVNAVRREQNREPVNECVFMVVRQRNRYEDDILQSRKAAEEAQLWLSTILQSIGDAVIATDAQGFVVFMNPVAEALTEWPQSEALGRPLDTVFVIIDEETHQPIESPVAVVLREKRITDLTNHTLLVTRNGKRIPIDDNGAPIRNDAGEILGVVLVFRDFTERRQTEQALLQHQSDIEALNIRLQRAMTETHHRVKNNLQVISALVEMQMTMGAVAVPSGELVRLSQHIRGLAALHDLLTYQTKQGGGAEKLSVRDTLGQLFPLLEGISQGRDLVFDLDDRFLPIRQATALVVLANELVSNATKHGEGDIRVVFRTSDNIGIFEVWDDGRGFPPDFNPATAANTGVELLETISRHDLDGTIAYLNRAEGGARVVVTFPLG